MTIERALHEFRVLGGQAAFTIYDSIHGGMAIGPAEALSERLKKLLKDTEQFQADAKQLKQWEQERFQESGWSKSPTQGF